MIKVHVLFFSTIRAQIGKRTLEIEMPPGARIADLKREISQLFPDAAGTIEGMLTSVDKVFSDDSTEIPDQAEVAFFPYVAGG
jgi:molybdopterin converting factor small subunit